MRNPKSIAIDTETTGTLLHSGHRAFMVTACDEDEKVYSWQWPVNPLTRQVEYSSGEVKRMLVTLNKYDPWIFHNAKFDLLALFLTFIPYTKWLKQVKQWSKDAIEQGQFLPFGHHVEDTICLAHVLNSSDAIGLKDLAIKYLGMLPTDQEDMMDEIRRARRQASKQHPPWPLGEVTQWDSWMPKALNPHLKPLEDKTLRYGIADVVRTIRLWKHLWKHLNSWSKAGSFDRDFEHYRNHLLLQPLLLRMEAIGLPLDMDGTARLCIDLNGRKRQYHTFLQKRAKEHGLPEFNPQSSYQLRILMYEKYGFPSVKRTPKGQLSTDAETLELLREHDLTRKQKNLLDALYASRKAETGMKYLQGYMDSARAHEDQACRLHPSLNQTGTKTTRFSGSNPNPQNVGVRAELPLRKAFRPIQGTFWYCVDYSQLELRILSVMADEPNMLEAFEAGADIHQWTADLCGITRKAAKNANFAIVYGAGKAKLQAMTGVENIGDLFRQAYTDIARFVRRTINQAEADGVVYTADGYPLAVGGDRTYKAVDYVIQGTAGQIVKKAMLALFYDGLGTRRFPGVEIINNIHDELIFEVPNRYRKSKGLIKFIKERMEFEGARMGIKTPVSFKIVTTNWMDAKEVPDGQ